MIALNVVALLFVLFHAVTWFNLAPAAMVVNVGGRRVPDALIVGGNYAAWAAASALIAVGAARELGTRDQGDVHTNERAAGLAALQRGRRDGGDDLACAAGDPRRGGARSAGSPRPTYERLAWLLASPIVRLALLVVCATSLLHWAHRFRYTLYDGLQLKHLHEGINFACYGGAILGSVVALYLLFVVL